MTLVRVLGFSLAVLLLYTLFANILPQVQSNPPSEEVFAPTGTLDKAGFAAWGERVFRGKGTCTLCHNNLGRAPDLLKLDLAAALPSRIADARYKGKAAGKTGAKAIEIYIRESLLDPSAYVVAGFGKKGSGDMQSPMRPVDKPPVGLKPPEIDAVIAFLQSRAGFEITVALPKAGEATAQKSAAKKTEGGGEDGDGENKLATTAKAAIEKYTCNGCHDLFGSEADAGPRLERAAERLGPGGLRKAILDPNAAIAKGFERDLMPKDYATKMRISELALIIDYLTKLKGKKTGGKEKANE